MRASLHSNERNLYLPLSPASSFLNQMINEQSQCSLNIDPFLFCYVLNFLIIFFVCMMCAVGRRVLSTFTWVVEIKLKLWSSLSGHKSLTCLVILPTPCYFEAKFRSLLALNSQPFPWCNLSRAGMFAGFSVPPASSQPHRDLLLIVNARLIA